MGGRGQADGHIVALAWGLSHGFWQVLTALTMNLIPVRAMSHIRKGESH